MVLPDEGQLETSYPLLVPRDRETQRVVGVDERARQVVGVDLAAVLVEVLEDLFADDPFLRVDVEERGRQDDLAEQGARGVQ